MENKVIINLDEYLIMKETIDKIKKIHMITVLDKDHGVMYDPAMMGFAKAYATSEIRVSRKELEEYINDILGVSGYDLIITEDK